MLLVEVLFLGVYVWVADYGVVGFGQVGGFACLICLGCSVW